MSKKYEGYVISHTHWDREWYRTFESYRHALIDTFDLLLHILDTDPEYKHFCTDGQTIVLEDYFEIRPEMKEKFRNYCLEGRIAVGPWYIMPDEFLTDGESIIRNFARGFDIANDYGGPMMTGYVCDCFGHISQLPQLLQGFGIDNAYGARGVGERPGQEKLEFEWASPDGSKVLFIHQLYNYSNAAGLGYPWIHHISLRYDADGRAEFSMEEAFKRINREMAKMLPMASTKALRFDNGCDHMPPQPELSAVIKAVNADPEMDCELCHVTWPEYVNRVRALSNGFDVYEGEMRDSKYTGILNSVFSSHMELKLENERAEVALERVSEPAASFAWLLGDDYPHGFFRHAWRLLLMNHPHDSICGCSIDQVHREMMPRFQRAEQVCEEIDKRAATQLGQKINTAAAPKGYEDSRWLPLVVVNPLNAQRGQEISFSADWELAEGEEPTRQFKLVDEAGREQLAELNASDPAPRVTTAPTHEGTVEVYRAQAVQGSFLAEDLPELGYKTFYLVPGVPEVIETDVWAGNDWIENAWFKVTAKSDGTLEVFDKYAKATYSGLLVFEHSSDRGDGYYYAAVPDAPVRVFDSLDVDVLTRKPQPYKAALELTSSLAVPAGLTADFGKQTDELVEVPMKVEVSLCAERPRIEVKLSLDNCAKNWRLRALLPTGLKSDTVTTEQAFDLTERIIGLPEAEGWVEAPVPWQPFQNFVDISAEGRGLAVATKGIREYEAIKNADGTVTLALSVFRAVYGFGGLTAPDAQMQGKLEFEFALMPHVGDALEGGVWAKTQSYRTPALVTAAKVQEGDLAPSGSLLLVSPETFAVSAVKVADREEALIVRAFNLARQPVKGTLWSHKPVKRATLTDLYERELLCNELPLSEDGHTIQLEAGPAKIVTVKLEF